MTKDLVAQLKGMLDTGFLEELPKEDLDDILKAISEGAQIPAEMIGFGPDALNAIEQMGLNYYRNGHLEKAWLLFGFVLQLDPTRSTTWRALGACAHLQKRYDLAAHCYEGALANQENDLIAQTLLGECLCHLGEKERGLGILEAVVGRDAVEPAAKPYVARARSILEAKGGMPSVETMRARMQEVAKEAAQGLGEKDLGAFAFDPEREITWQDAKKHPKLAKICYDICRRIGEGKVTIGQVVGFTERQFDGAYKLACGYLHSDQPLETVRLASLLLFLDPYASRLHRLMGIAYHRLNQFPAAVFHYAIALIDEPDDPETMVYKGEAEAMAGDVSAGLKTLRQGLEAARGRSGLEDAVARAEVLLKRLER